ncbi:aromatic acid/H+ symport family MFS transporter [Gordonia sp. PKS22-38]|uniref:Aromatic acid/H+ symport family MFS transporter n=1 Tax=Gordonia prachuapensis TaxID=3115651 RepID=A0ABU7MW49_9ACTN|nr:aromatic acid/H+ symport family MFS transporter [Gordonia sp. PKS22-38]
MENSSVSTHHRSRASAIAVVLVCWGTVVADGFDIVAYGVALPRMFDEPGWGMTSQTAGFIGSAALAGMFIGSIVAGTVADRIGKKRLLLASVGLFSILTAACALANDPMVFAALRFVAGLGLGGVVPIAGAITAEFTPIRYRNLAYAVMFAGLPTGAIIASLVGIWVIPELGWRAIFALGVVPALIIIPIGLRFLPGSSPADSRAPATHEPQTPPTPDRPGKAGELVSPRLRLATLCFFATTFLCLFMIYAIQTWLPRILNEAGYSLGGALTAVLIFNVGSAVGVVVVGFVADRLGTNTTLLGAFALTTVSIAGLAVTSELVVLYILIGLAGVGAVSGQTLIVSLLSQTYPRRLVAPGMGWTLAFGRLGSIAAPTILGFFVAAGFGLRGSALALATAGALALAVGVVNPAGRRGFLRPQHEAQGADATDETVPAPPRSTTRSTS